MKHRHWARRIVGIGALVLCFCLAASFLNEFFVDKGHYRDLKRVLYTDAADSYPLLFVGGSHMNGAINPNYFQKTFGVASFNVATAGQEFCETYYLLKEALKRQHAKVVVLDVYYALNKSPYGNGSFTHRALDPMVMSVNKLEAIRASVPKGQRAAYLFPLMLYHSRWDTLPELVEEWKDYTGPYTGALGFGGGAVQYGKEMQYDNWDDTHCTPLAEKQETYLQKFFQLAHEKNFRLVLVNFPYEQASDELTEWAGDGVGKINQIQKEAAAAGVPFLNLNRPEQIKAMGFDFPTMMNNASHVNYNGAYKVTAAVGRYLQSVTPELFQ